MREEFPCVWSTVSRRAWLAALSLGCFGVVAMGMALQHMLNLAPCPLCIFQRLLYLLVGAVAFIGFLLPVLEIPMAAIAGLLALLGLAVSVWQTWMQAYPHLAPTCNFTDPNLIERLVYWLGSVSPDWFLATGLCTSREWELFGLSMANWSVFLFAGIAGYVLLLIRFRKR